MLKSEQVYREILFQAMERQNKRLTQSYLASSLGISLSTVNLAVRPLARMNSIKIGRRGFAAIDVKKILYYWASIRNLDRDIIYKTRIKEPVRDIEKQMPDDIVFSAFSAYKFKFKDVPADYSEVYVYGSEKLKQRWKIQAGNPNLFVLHKDSLMDKYGKTVTLANLFVDLWNLRQWYAKDFLNALEGKIGRFLE